MDSPIPFHSPWADRNAHGLLGVSIVKEDVGFVIVVVGH
jgi:hypothetical protein